MSSLGIGVMIVICGLVWGGFLGLLAKALRSEKGKRNRRRDGAGGA